jgi:hypothetical protein
VGQKERDEPPCRHKLVEPVKHRVEDGIEEEGEGADHDHDLESHDEKGDDADAGGDPCDYPFNVHAVAPLRLSNPSHTSGVFDPTFIP